MTERTMDSIGTEPDPAASEALHKPLDRSRIMDAVLQSLQAEGLEGMSMRKIADSLGVKAAALYYHVKDKEQLLHWLAERISSEVAFPDAELPWQEQIRKWALNFRATLHRYQDAVKIMNATFAGSPHRLAHIEFLFRLFAESGFQDTHIPWLAAMLKNQVFAFVDEESRLSDRAGREHEDIAELGETQTERFESLPRDKYPHMARLATYTASVDWDREFLFGLDVLLDGFEAKRGQRQD